MVAPSARAPRARAGAARAGSALPSVGEYQPAIPRPGGRHHRLDLRWGQDLPGNLEVARPLGPVCPSGDLRLVLRHKQDAGTPEADVPAQFGRQTIPDGEAVLGKRKLWQHLAL